MRARTLRAREVAAGTAPATLPRREDSPLMRTGVRRLVQPQAQAQAHRLVDWREGRQAGSASHQPNERGVCLIGQTAENGRITPPGAFATPHLTTPLSHSAHPAHSAHPVMSLSPLMRRASWMSFTWIVTRLAWIAQRLLQGGRGVGEKGRG